MLLSATIGYRSEYPDSATAPPRPAIQDECNRVYRSSGGIGREPSWRAGRLGGATHLEGERTALYDLRWTQESTPYARRKGIANHTPLVTAYE